ncbi:carbohydrate ABC transporter permease [Intestinimonas massiliensis (ex Afouda et al. 2020)]|uniref:carbohydrate ABC transporter permease n=1 Tax=Intestinimonas massiliensis (ex Afouda et al. 2020) TaxID=1673721 RepID=UPI001F5E40C2|nr:sugar ABC transporter permease [Intestinimonas massiliensis (ex Afouda et al. 2020)]
MGKKAMRLSAAARREEHWGYLMIAPTIIGLVVLNLWPFVQTIYTSFCEHLGFGHYKFIGIGNYVEMFQSPEVWRATWNTILFCILTVPVGLFLSLLVAMMLNAKIKGKGIFRTIFFLPMVCAPAAITMVWRWIFNSDYGILNQLLGAHINWITDSHFVMIACAIVAIWSNIGYDAVLLLAGLQNISKTYYEAAEIDGTSKINQFFQITLPMVSPTLFVVMIMRLMSSIKVYDLIYMMVEDTNPALTSVQSLMYLFYRETFVAGSRGYGAAIVVWTVVLIGAITVIQFIGQKKWVNYDV